MVDGTTTNDEQWAPESRAQRTITCPHCRAQNPLRPGAVFVDCSACNRSFKAPGAAIGDPDAERSRPAAFRIGSRAPTDVGLRRTGAAAAVVTLLFYAAIVAPLSNTYFGELFGARGWVPYVIAWMSAWAGILLAAKAVLLRAQRTALQLDLLPERISERITRDSAQRFAHHIRGLALRTVPQPRLLGGGTTRSFLVERVERALDHFAKRGRASDVIDQLGAESQLDASAVESSYTMVRVFIWAIPLLGFIGTVLGISAAVAGFSDSVASAVDLDVMKQSIGSVTTGLGVAFDTTLLALVMSIFIMFPTSSLQKSEQDFLDQVELYCEQRLARRLDDEDVAPQTDGAAAMNAFATLTEGATQGLAQLEKQLSELVNTVGALDARLKSASGDDRES